MRARTGLPALLELDFQQRAARLKALAKYLNERKEELYAISRPHRRDAQRQLDRHRRRHRHAVRLRQRWAATSCRRATWCTKGRPIALGKKGGFAGTHILVPRGGVAVHINAFNFPVWGLLEKFAPSFLAGMPCIGKPATATSYLTEALVRLIDESGLLPEGSLQLVIGGTGDLLDRLDRQDVVTFTGSADTAAKLRVHPNLIAQLDPVQRRGRLAQLRDPRARRDARRRGVRPVRQGGGARDDGQGGPEVHRDPPRHRAAPAPRRGGARSCARAWPRSWSATRRSKACAWARSPRRRSSATWPSAWPMLAQGQRDGLRRSATASRRWARAWPTARSSRRRCCCARDADAATTRCTTSRRSARSAR